MCSTTLLALGACQQKEEAAPSGANTFSCRIDGKEFTPYLKPILFTGPRKALEARRTDRQANGLVLQAKDSFNELVIYLAATQGTGRYSLGFARQSIPYPSNPDSYGLYERIPPARPGDDPFKSAPGLLFYTDATSVGTVTITRFDTVARVAGGSFEYTAREAATGKRVRITEGKFDVKF